MKVASLITGRGGSRSIKNKNIYPILGRPLLAYPILASKNAKLVDHTFLTTDSKLLASHAEEWGASVINRPPSLGEDLAHLAAMVHGYKSIVDAVGKVELVVIMMANCPTILPETIDLGIQTLIDDTTKSIDSCVTVSRYNEFNPSRARKVVGDRLQPFFDPAAVVGSKQNDSGHDRDALGDVYFYDGGAAIVRAHCLEDPELHGELPYKWIGRSVKPLIQEFGMDVDNIRGIANADFWLRENGFSLTNTPYNF